MPPDDQGLLDKCLLESLLPLCKKCWSKEPTQRPKMSKVENRLDKLYEVVLKSFKSIAEELKKTGEQEWKSL